MITNESLISLFCNQNKPVKWRVYLIGDNSYFGALTFSKELQMMVLCVCSFHCSPMISLIDSKEVERQCSDQGFDNHSLPNLLSTFEERLKFPSDDLRIMSRGEYLEFVMNITKKIKVQIRLKTTPVNQSYKNDVYKAISLSLIDGVCLLHMAMEKLVAIIGHKDQAIGFLKDTVGDLGYEGLIAKWAPPNSFNRDLLTPFDVDNWQSAWATEKVPSDVLSGGLNKISDTLNLLAMKKSNINDPTKSSEKSLKTKSINVLDSNFSDSFVQFEEPHLKFDDEHDLPESQERLQPKEEVIQNIENSDQQTQASNLFPVSERINSDTCTESQSNLKRNNGSNEKLEVTSSLSPSKKRRKFGKVKSESVEP